MTICQKPVRYALGNYTGLPLYSVIVLELRLSLLRLLQFYSIIKSLLPTKLYKGVAGVLSRVEVIGLRATQLKPLELFTLPQDPPPSEQSCSSAFSYGGTPSRRLFHLKIAQRQKQLIQTEQRKKYTE